MKIYSDALGRWTTELNIKSGKDFTTKVIGTADSIRESFARTDKWIQNNRLSSMSLLDASATWRSDGPTDPQKKMLKRLGIPLTADMTKGMASQIISRYYENNPKPKWLQNKISSKNRW
jgi:hypothetical protein